MINLLPDQTIFAMWLIFMAVVIALNYLVFKPTLEILEQRKRGTEGFKKEAVDLERETAEAIALYEKKMHEVRLHAAQEREALVGSGREKESEILGRARAENEKKLSELRAEIMAQSKEAEFQLRQHAQELAKLMVEKVLEKKAA